MSCDEFLGQFSGKRAQAFIDILADTETYEGEGPVEWFEDGDYEDHLLQQLHRELREYHGTYASELRSQLEFLRVSNRW